MRTEDGLPLVGSNGEFRYNDYICPRTQREAGLEHSAWARSERRWLYVVLLIIASALVLWSLT